ncbi:MAG: zinc ABC transporter substrate-binding protein, partial [Alphaproteobacteria bacterium]|nr:zinc ABC transporter substrate-binding protein [Alphaproteobacteria bacterium]
MAMILLVIVGLVWSSGVRAAPRTVVTIKPIHSLVAAVMAGIGQPRLLVTGAASPHAHA